jgi:hypothetical protein
MYYTQEPLKELESVALLASRWSTTSISRAQTVFSLEGLPCGCSLTLWFGDFLGKYCYVEYVTPVLDLRLINTEICRAQIDKLARSGRSMFARSSLGAATGASGQAFVRFWSQSSSPWIVNDNVLYHSLLGLASYERLRDYSLKSIAAAKCAQEIPTQARLSFPTRCKLHNQPCGSDRLAHIPERGVLRHCVC